MNGTRPDAAKRPILIKKIVTACVKVHGLEVFSARRDKKKYSRQIDLIGTKPEAAKVPILTKKVV